jgi:hypothetical protein
MLKRFALAGLMCGWVLPAAAEEIHLSRTFTTSELDGQVAAVAITGSERQLRPETCELRFTSYIFGNDESRAGAHFSVRFANDHGPAGILSFHIDGRDFPPRGELVEGYRKVYGRDPLGERSIEYAAGVLTLRERALIVDPHLIPLFRRYELRERTARITIDRELGQVEQIEYTGTSQSARNERDLLSAERSTVERIRCTGPFARVDGEP